MSHLQPCPRRAKIAATVGFERKSDSKQCPNPELNQGSCHNDDTSDTPYHWAIRACSPLREEVVIGQKVKLTNYRGRICLQSCSKNKESTTHFEQCGKIANDSEQSPTSLNSLEPPETRWNQNEQLRMDVNKFEQLWTTARNYFTS